MRLAKQEGLGLSDLLTNTNRPFSWFGLLFPAIRPNLFALSFVARFKK